MEGDILDSQNSQPLVRVRHLSKSYVRGHALRWRASHIVALRDVNLEVAASSTLALVGESGSGKSTLARCLARLEEPSAGQIWFDGQNLLAATGQALFHLRAQIQLILQETASAFNPRFSAEEIIMEPVNLQRLSSPAERRRRCLELLEQVGLARSSLRRFPHEFSGGQRQRLAIARALALTPRFLILDESLAGLDLSVQAQIMDLLQELQSRHRLTYLYISHDLGLMGAIADEIAVLHQGKIVERQTARELFASPQHPITSALLRAIPGGRFAAFTTSRAAR